MKPTVQMARALAASVVAAKVTAVGAVAAAIVGATPTAVAVVSTLVFTVQFAAAGEPAAPLVIPGICTVAAVLLDSEQVPPLSASVNVTVVVTVVGFVTAQLLKPLVSTTVGVAGTVKIEVAFGNATETVSPARSWPVALEVKPTVQVPRALAARVVEAKVTALGAVAALIVIPAPGLPGVVSLLVLTFQRVVAGVPAAPAVTPTIWNERTVPLAMTQLLAESSSVSVTVCPEPVAETSHLLKPLVAMIVGFAGTEKTEVAFGKTTVIVSPVRRLPVPDTVMPIVQVARALAARVLPANDTAVGATAALMVIAAGFAAVVSELVLTFHRVAAGVPAAPEVIPAIWTMAGVPAGSEHVPPLSLRVIVTVCEAPVASSAQLAKPFVAYTVGVAGTLKTEVAFGKTTVIVSPVRSDPVALVVKPTVHSARALALRVFVPKVTAVGAVATAITGGAAGLATVVSALVLTFQRLAAGEPATPAVTPRICRAAAALFGREQVPPLSARVIVTVCDAPVAAAEQLAKALVRSTVGVAGTENTDVAFGKTTVIVSPASSPPVEVELNPTVHVERAAAASVVDANVTAVGVVAAAITTGEPGLIALVESTDVLTLKVLARREPAAGFVSPASWSVAGVLGATAHEPPASVTVTVCAAAEAVALQFAKAGPRLTAGVAGTVKPALNTTVIVDPAASVPVELVVKPTVQVERARAVCGEPAKLTLETDGSIVYGTGRVESSSWSSSSQPSFARRSDQRAPAGVTALPEAS